MPDTQAEAPKPDDKLDQVQRTKQPNRAPASSLRTPRTAGSY